MVKSPYGIYLYHFTLRVHLLYDVLHILFHMKSLSCDVDEYLGLKSGVQLFMRLLGL